MRDKSRTPKRPQFKLGSQTFSPKVAKAHLGRLAAKASKGETVYIVSGQRRYHLQEVLQNDPIPMRPSGFFANCYTKTELREESLLAKSSIIWPPRDLE